ncbi:MAG: tRNA uridine-5-carboxymethylaminomethyl(34) synthesis GTPase MnmE [Candidatus Eremiobacteraeota bacterium]|nr:tRNA uridine-5-carboxymethylaminomethyl(34) synthesis GTPase MnmE [Candidatus Eremiobacteraeota bacterium]MBV9055698.1 tRNA uridine-5-carboxymethylaminomethyl(34) synthesis GTPase MnmE [Candidatus Eremiobacteraeota bacterium]MBV9699216.1 tRNA uridine-5-carboxymethylaminomethyl(34) synthesis GTPase MnmE [Candidatus Eremiobacteraeota bacterium]
MSGGGDTIAAIATPPGKGAIAIVRISGPETKALARRLVQTKRPLRARVATYVTICDERGQRLDRALAIRFRAPHSYTGEEMLELQLHGSPVLAREVMRALLACGARLAEPGEFTRQAFLNGKMDLHAAAAVADVVSAETSAAVRAAFANLGGGLASEVERIRESLRAMLEELAAAIDFPDEVAEPPRPRLEAGVAGLLERLERLRHDGELGQLLREGVGVAIVGPPNAGKSSLLNALLGSDRAIVSEVPGTTRDTIEETIAIDGVPVRLVDTAGIRAHADRLEGAGIERTQRALAAARIIVLVIDGSVPAGGESTELLARTEGRERIVFFNKADLGTRGCPVPPIAGSVVGSVYDGRTLTALRAAIARTGWRGERLDLSRPHLAALHEFEAVNAAIDALEGACAALRQGHPMDFAAGELQRAFSSLGHVSCREGAEDIIGGIFSRFCIGK